MMPNKNKFFTPGVLENVPNHNFETFDDMTNKIKDHPAFGVAYKWGKKDFELAHLLGRGRYGRVHAAKEKRAKFLVAMKIICRSKLDKEYNEEQVLGEIQIHSKLRHPNILRLYTWFNDESHIFIALEIVSNGELYKHLKVAPLGYFEEQRAAKYIYQIADALNYCHRHNVMHRYIRPENMFLTFNDNIKLSDFAWSTYMETNEPVCREFEPTHKHFDDTVDQWCLGIMCYELLTGVLPVYLYQKSRYLRLKFPGHLSAGARDLIIRLLKEKIRISLIDVMQHSWVRANMYKSTEPSSD